MPGLLLALLLSGGASLIYQVTWARRLADVTSATTTAQAVVLAVFFAGLGLGAVYPGRLAARAKAPLRVYAYLEIGILVGALASTPVFGSLDRVRAAVTRVGLGPSAASIVEIALASVFLLGPTTLMGASLPFVLEHAERVAGSVARTRFVPVAYAVNTLGAALGCALAGYVLIEKVGLFRATFVGAALSLASAAIAIRIAREAPPAASTQPSGANGTIAPGILVAAAAAGAVGVGAEVVWTRLFSLIVLNTVYAFTQVLIAVLVGIVAGAMLARFIGSRMEGRALLRAAGLAQAGSAIAIGCVGPLSLLLAGRTGLEARIASGQAALGVVALVGALVVPVALNAATLPLLVQGLSSSRVSSSFGAMYAANTAGSVLGSLLTGFVLLPAFGTTGASAFLEALSIALAFGLVWMGSVVRREAFAVLAPGAVVGIIHLLFPDAARDIYEARIPKGTRILDLREGVTSDVIVTESETGQRRLWINSSWVAGTGGGHKALGHLPALFVPRPKRAVGIALGTGQTFAAIFAHGLDELHVVEINGDVIRLSRQWFGDANGNLFERPGVVIHRDDGRAFLRSRTDRFDLIVLEPLQAWSAGTSSLYSREFYEEARAVLEPSGIVAQWIPFYGQGLEETRAMVGTALQIFPNATLWLDEHDGILLLHAGTVTLPPRDMQARIDERGIAADLETKSIRTSADVMSLLVLGPEGLARWARGAPILSDDRPFLEFAAARQLGESSFAAIVESIVEARAGGDAGASSIAGNVPEAAEADIAGAARLADALSENAPFDARAGRLEKAIAEAPSSATLRGRYRSVMEAWLAAAAARRGGAEVLAILERGIHHDDDYGEAMLNLAVLSLQRGDAARARDLVERATTIPRVSLRATQMLASLP